MPQPEKIVIVGGVTAGWMAANLMIRRCGGRGIEIALLEAPDTGIIGEGSTPQLKAFFDSIGVEDHEWMPDCNATFKVGISFHDWSTKAAADSYFYRFPAQTDTQNYKAFVYHCHLRRQGIDVDAHPDRCFLPAYLVAHRQRPHPDHNFPFPVRYGYHFDVHLLGQFLRGVAVARGVRHIQGKVAAVSRNENGDLAELRLEDGGSFGADLFVDSTGFRSRLLQQALEVPLERVNFRVSSVWMAVI